MSWKKDKVINIKADWKHPTEIRFGLGRIRELPNACKKLQMQTPLLVTDRGVASLSFIKEMVKLNRDAGIETGVFSEITAEPDSNCIKQGASVFKEGRFDGIIAVGGGSALDAGKAISLAVATDMEAIWNYVFGVKGLTTLTPQKIQPVIAVPTTAGTGSEVDAYAVIINQMSQVKMSLYHQELLPRLVIADPELTQELPSHMTATTGFDALSHNLEALCSPVFNPMSDAIALQGILYLKEWLPLAFREGRNLQARFYTMAASIMGGVAFDKGLGAMHSLAHSIGAVFKIHHGQIIAVVMPYVLRFNRRQIIHKIEQLGRLLGFPENSFDAVLNWILELRREFGIPHSLRGFGVKEEHIPSLVGKVLSDGNVSTNPISLNKENVDNLLTQAIRGNL